jgi:methionyl-tRNA synthetase
MAGKLLVTSALPYANGPLHLGHVVEYVQSDILVRFLRSTGRDVVFFCADDTHGTPVEISAARQGVAPEQYVASLWVQHRKDFADFGIALDAFYTTHSPENRRYSELIYERLKAAGDIVRRSVEQTYCEVDRRFLPDRFVRGTCPNCKSPDQYGDVCEVCGKTYTPAELIHPCCALCGTPPVRRTSEHLFFRLSRHQAYLQEVVRHPGFVPESVANQLQSFFDQGLNDWDISRDGPYFGFPIPGEVDKFFYVWLDAPIGYIATTEKWAKDTGRAADALAYWAEDADAEIIHVIGKDIVYFHALFWPAMLQVARLKRPSRLVVHGHLTLDGAKMSKSRGTLVDARTYLDVLDPAYLRYFFGANLGPTPEDFDLSLADFRQRVNGELVNNFCNLANRVLSPIAGPLGGKLAPPGTGPGRELVEDALRRMAEVRAAYQRLDFRSAVRASMEISQTANQFLQVRAPWAKVKAEPEVARADLSDAAEVAYLVGALLQPVVPTVAESLFVQLQAPPLTFAGLEQARYPLLDRARPVGTPAPLLPRMEEAQVKRIIVPEGTDQARPKSAARRAPPDTAPPQLAPHELGRIDLRVGQVLSAERVPKADKLLRLGVDLGEGGPRSVVAGLAEAYAPEALVGRRLVLVANLAPRTIRGIPSQGMVLAGGPGGPSLRLVDPGEGPAGRTVGPVGDRVGPAIPEISMEEFSRVVLRAGQVRAVETVPEASDVVRLQVDIGEQQPRSIVVAGAPGGGAAVGQRVVVVANAPPRAISGLPSHGMLLASDAGGATERLLDPGDLAPGSEVR